MDTLEKLNGVVETLNNQNTTNMDLFTELSNVGAMRLFCPAKNNQFTTDFNGQNGV